EFLFSLPSSRRAATTGGAAKSPGKMGITLLAAIRRSMLEKRRIETSGGRISTVRLPIFHALAVVIAVLLSAAAPARAQQQPWRHGIIEPKSDAGFQVMAVRGGFAAKEG